MAGDDPSAAFSGGDNELSVGFSKAENDIAS